LRKSKAKEIASPTRVVTSAKISTAAKSSSTSQAKPVVAAISSSSSTSASKVSSIVEAASHNYSWSNKRAKSSATASSATPRSVSAPKTASKDKRLSTVAAALTQKSSSGPDPLNPANDLRSKVKGLKRSSPFSLSFEPSSSSSAATVQDADHDASEAPSASIPLQVAEESFAADSTKRRRSVSEKMLSYMQSSFSSSRRPTSSSSSSSASKSKKSASASTEHVDSPPSKTTAPFDATMTTETSQDVTAPPLDQDVAVDEEMPSNGAGEVMDG
jgi:hypothetical protein